ncbi:CsgG/HfaB family protein [Agarilytica rhodophyticola]|uniref:CsgG/HfaB family protein n=1 Tax=Agarilytica rhodophyticola TaxID=1737490 RepID=UPI000B34383A|nr:CsgG/HfaB family protein [Agarilytica rhodophyticola]
MLSLKRTLSFICLPLIIILGGCSTTESHREVVSEKVQSYGTSYSGKKHTLVVGKFENRSNYLQGLFSSNIDRLGNQAKTILKTHLQQTNRFKLVDRENMEGIAEEAELAGIQQKLKGARYTVTGAVTEFGRKQTGDKQLFGILGSGKKQTAYAKVSLNIVDVVSSEIIYSVQGAGEYALSNREVLGFGSDAGYDATLNGKVLNFAITNTVNAMVRDIENGVWQVTE